MEEADEFNTMECELIGDGKKKGRRVDWKGNLDEQSKWVGGSK